jgi:hypothetical protein
MSYEDTMYERANDVFDSVVFTRQEYLDAYNNADEEVRDELYEIIGKMCDAAEKAMVDCAMENRERFYKVIDAVERRTA